MSNLSNFEKEQAEEKARIDCIFYNTVIMNEPVLFYGVRAFLKHDPSGSVFVDNCDLVLPEATVKRLISFGHIKEINPRYDFHYWHLVHENYTELEKVSAKEWSLNTYKNGVKFIARGGAVFGELISPDAPIGTIIRRPIKSED